MNRILMGVAALVLAGAYAASADVLVMEDGRRIRGELVSVNRGTVLFDEIRTGTTRKHRLRINKEEVARIVLRSVRETTISTPGTTAVRTDARPRGDRDDGPFGPGRGRPRRPRGAPGDPRRRSS